MQDDSALPLSLRRAKERLRGVASEVPKQTLEGWLATASTIATSLEEEKERLRRLGLAVDTITTGKTEATDSSQSQAMQRGTRNISLIERYQGCLLGLACGDAVGCTVEFMPRNRFKPLTDMVGGGKFKLNAGEWTDDTSMALCLAASLIDKQGFDAKDQMDRYLHWAETGSPGPRSTPVGIGKTVLNALFRYRRTGEPYAGVSHERSAGNGALMRLAPVVLAYYPEHANVHNYAKLSTLVTHGAEQCISTTRHLAEALYQLLSGCDKESIQAICTDWEGLAEVDSREITGSGYAPESLTAAVWSFLTTSSFEQAVLAAANLGDDADTTAAICGQIAGAYYGISAIPSSWLDKLYQKEQLLDLAGKLYQMSHSCG